MKPPSLTDYLAQKSPAEHLLSRIFSHDARLVILDIGSCEGEESIRYARTFPRARVFAFEPLPSNQDIIRANLARYPSGRRIELVPLALSDRAGEAVFHVSSGRPTDTFAGADWNYGNKSSSLLPPASAEPMHGWIRFNDTINVRTETLAHFCSDRRLARIDFIHLDVQGAELRVLQGAGDRLGTVTALWLEVADQELYRGQALRSEIERFLHERGFALVATAMRGVEGDEFYVNLRQPRTWIFLIRQRLRAWYGRLRFRAGALRSQWFHTRP